MTLTYCLLANARSSKYYEWKANRAAESSEARATPVVKQTLFSFGFEASTGERNIFNDGSDLLDFGMHGATCI